ncbi:MAG: lipocalin family protein [Flavobacteriales bacterium]|nr:lipocalin family protein [Flavobacteriales bacterium]
MQYNTSKIGIMVFVFASISMIAMSQSIQTVPYVDLERYAGKWYEIASISQRFQKTVHAPQQNTP